MSRLDRAVRAALLVSGPGAIETGASRWSAHRCRHGLRFATILGRAEGAGRARALTRVASEQEPEHGRPPGEWRAAAHPVRSFAV